MRQLVSVGLSMAVSMARIRDSFSATYAKDSFGLGVTKDASCFFLASQY